MRTVCAWRRKLAAARLLPAAIASIGSAAPIAKAIGTRTITSLQSRLRRRRFSRFWLRRGLGRLLLLCFSGLLLLLLSLALLALPPLAPPRAAGGELRLRQVLGQRAGDLLQRAEPFAGGLDQLRRARCVALGRCEQRRTDRQRLLERGVHELRGVLLMPVPARVRESSEQSFGLGELRARAAVLQLARRA